MSGTLGRPSRENACGFVPKIMYDRLMDENEKLRDFANLLWLIVSHESSFVSTELIDEARGLGIEVE